MANHPHLSIIVPVYNTERYVRNTLDSVTASGFRDLEIIVINDGSTDDSLAVVEKWRNDASAPCVIVSQPNMGLGAARNAGLRIASGEFVCFLDSDDLVDSCVYPMLLEYARASDADLALARAQCFGFGVTDRFKTWPFGDEWLWQRLSGRTETTSVHRFPGLLRLEPSATRGIYRRSFLDRHAIRFPEGILYEDLPFHFATVGQSERVIIHPSVLLYYRVGRTGQITLQSGERRFEMLESARQAFSIVDQLAVDEDASAAAYCLACRMLYWCGTYVAASRRHEYMAKATELARAFVGKRPLNWREWCEGDKEQLIVEALTTGGARLLTDLTRKRVRPSSLLTQYLKVGSVALRRATHCEIKTRVLRVAGYR